jgi:hypothetical protein
MAATRDKGVLGMGSLLKGPENLTLYRRFITS